MKKVFVALLFIGSLCAFQKTQDQKFNLSLSAPDINLVLKGLGKLPLEESQELYMKIVGQANSQLPSELPKGGTAPVKQDSTSKKK